MGLLKIIRDFVLGAIPENNVDQATEDYDNSTTKVPDATEEIDSIVLRKLYPELSGCNGSYPGDSYNVESKRRRIAEIRTWSAGLADADIRLAYENWLDYFSNDIEAAAKELRTGKHKKEMEIYWAENKAKSLRVADYEKTHSPIPTPPRGQS